MKYLFVLLILLTACKTLPQKECQTYIRDKEVVRECRYEKK